MDRLCEEMNMLDLIFDKLKMDDMVVGESCGAIVAKDSFTEWVGAEIYDFILNDCLMFDEDLNLVDGLYLREDYVDWLKKKAKEHGVSIVKYKVKI